ncbi:MAG: metallopeptidase TldD-related protein [Labedaea sp.]
MAAGRCVVAGSGSSGKRMGTVFALSGGAATHNGQTLPIGFSGSGTGVDVLGNRALAETIAWIRGALATAGPPVHWRFPAVLSPQAAAVLVHEAVGHFAEAMHVGAPAMHRLFTRIAGACLSVVDEPNSGDHDFDDEGVLRLGRPRSCAAAC